MTSVRTTRQKRYDDHSLFRLGANLANLLECELGMDHQSEIAALTPDVEGEPW
jgi:hypothetical protein